jgi:hypothetical protein
MSRFDAMQHFIRVADLGSFAAAASSQFQASNCMMEEVQDNVPCFRTG